MNVRTIYLLTSFYTVRNLLVQRHRTECTFQTDPAHKFLSLINPIVLGIKSGWNYRECYIVSGLLNWNGMALSWHLYGQRLYGLNTGVFTSVIWLRQTSFVGSAVKFWPYPHTARQIHPIRNGLSSGNPALTENCPFTYLGTSCLHCGKAWNALIAYKIPNSHQPSWKLAVHINSSLSEI